MKEKINEIKVPTINSVDKVKYSKFKKCLECLERDLAGTPQVLDNLDITFEYVVGSLFPNVLNNVQRELSQQYIKGFNERLKVEKIENKKALDYAVIDLKNAVNNIEIVHRQEGISESDIKVFKNVQDILNTLVDNINDAIKE